jgi:hypothetical protein
MNDIKVKVSGNFLILSSGSPEGTSRRKEKRPEISDLHSLRFQGTLSGKSRSKIRSLLSRWNYSIEEYNQSESRLSSRFQRKFGFLTLTLPSQQIESHKDVKRNHLNKFLIWLTRSYPTCSYFWKGELQKNGNIHFHILLDQFIPWREIRSQWNKILEVAGYVSAFRESCISKGWQIWEKYRLDHPKIDPEKCFKAWKDHMESDFMDPNSIDIHKLDDVDNVINYVLKYLSKQVNSDSSENAQDNPQLQDFGRIWGCSDILREIPPMEAKITTEEMKQIEEYISKDVIKELETEYCRVIILPHKQIIRFQTFFVNHFLTHNFNILQKLP